MTLIDLLAALSVSILFDSSAGLRLVADKVAGSHETGPREVLSGTSRLEESAERFVLIVMSALRDHCPVFGGQD